MRSARKLPHISNKYNPRDDKKPLYQLDALHPRVVAAHMPGDALQQAAVEHVLESFDTTARAGAGGTKVGLPGLRLLGRRRTAEFHEAFTETGRTKDAAPQLPGLSEFIGKPKDGPKAKVVKLNEAWCPDCGKQSVPVPLRTVNISMVGEPWPEVGLKPGDLIRHSICKGCWDKAKKQSENRMWGVWQGARIPMSMIHSIQRTKRLMEKIEEWMRIAWANRHENTFINEYGEDLADGR